MPDNEVSQSDQANPTAAETSSAKASCEPEVTVEQLQATWANKREAAATDHAPIVDDVLHRRAVERISQSMPSLTPEQIRRREAETAEREADRQKHARWSRWLAILQERGDRYADCRLATYEASTDAQSRAVADLESYCREMPDRLADGENVILFGPKGTGKDHLLMALVRVAVLHHGRYVIWQNGMDLFGDIRDAIDKGDAERALVNRLIAPDVLYISDPLPPVGPLSQHQMTMLFRILDGRYSRRKSTWITVNVAGAAELEERMSPQTADRLRHEALAIYCNWPSYRTGARR